jgi:glycosyltransferase involved in cell wall biosynthesis
VPEGDAQALAQALTRLQNDPKLRHRYAQAGRARVKAYFTHEQIAEQTLEVYGKILKGVAYVS